MLGLVLGMLALIGGPATSALAAATHPVSAAASPTSTPTATSADPSRTAAPRAVLLGIPGLSWHDIDPTTTPNIYAQFAKGAGANLNVRTIGASTCPASGWLSLGSGARAEAGPSPDPTLDSGASCPAMVSPVAEVAAGSTGKSRSAEGSDGDEDLLPAATIPGFDTVREPNQGSGYDVDYGMLARLVRESAAVDGVKGCVTAEGPGAAYAVADENGTVEDYRVSTLGPQTPGNDAPARPGTTGTGDTAASAPCRLELIDLGAIGGRSWLGDTVPNSDFTVDPMIDHERQVAEADRRVGEAVADLEAEAKDTGIEPVVFIAGLGDSSSLPRLRAFIASGPGFGPGTLSSATTRTPALLQLTDLAPGILETLGIDSPSGVSFEQTADAGSADARLADLVTSAQKAATVHKSLQTFSTVLDTMFYVLAVLAGVVLSARGLRSRFLARLLARRTKAPATAASPGAASSSTVAAVESRARTGLAWISLVFAAVPMGALLAGALPWARFPLPEPGLGFSVLIGSAVVLGLSLVPPWGRTWRGRVAAMSAVIVVIIAVDLATGSRLQANSLLGYNPIVGGRYYGLGNQGAAIFIVGLFVLAGIAASWLRARGHRILVWAVPAALGLAAVFVSGNPAWGAKFGGTIATLAGLLVLLALLLRIRLSIVRLGLIGLASLAVLIGIAFIDWLRPAGERSHFGTFFEQIVSGEVLRVIGRKLGANLHIIQINPALAIVTPIAILVVFLVLRYLLLFPRAAARPRVARALSPWRGRLPEVFADADIHFGFLGAVTGLTVGLLLTDSGIAVPSTGAMVLVPFLIALCAGLPAEAAAGSPDEPGSPLAEVAARSPGARAQIPETEGGRG